jgi:hypothetical protein
MVDIFYTHYQHPQLGPDDGFVMPLSLAPERWLYQVLCDTGALGFLT